MFSSANGMATQTTAVLPQPKISVVITTFNHARYLPQAIESVLKQAYPDTELIVVDDGSTDETPEVVKRYPSVVYVYQPNQGLSAARNKGVQSSTGDYLSFLDADDWFFDGALQAGAAALNANPQAAFAYGTYKTVSETNETVPETIGKQDFVADHYGQLLQNNFIAMHATVMYRRWVFDRYRFDMLLKAAEDYDLYLKITRLHPVVYHAQTVAAYRRHSLNMSGNVPRMLDSVIAVLQRQVPLLRTPAEREQWKNGRRFWRAVYGSHLIWQLDRGTFFRLDETRRRNLAALFRHNKKLFLNYLARKSLMGLKAVIKRKSPAAFLSLLHRAGFYKAYKPGIGKVRRGDFTTKPFSTNFGYDRGGPVDRYYIENFLEKNAALIKGRVLEIGDNEYTLRFGGEKVRQSDVLHVEDNNPKATFVGDLSDAPHLPDNAFDSIVLTQTLHLIYRHVEALRTCYRILKPGGTLLLTSPGITHIDQGEWRDYWYWSYTQAALNRLLSEAFPADAIETETFGNVLVATAFINGMGLPELSREEMDTHDPHYPVIITAKAAKPPGA